MGARNKLTAVAVRNAKEVGTYGDGGGLMLVVKASGARSWILRCQHAGSRRDFGLGSAADVSLAEARDQAEIVRKTIKSGVDPVAKKHKARIVIPTFKAAAEEVHIENKPTWKNVKHAADWLSSLEMYAFPKIGSLPVDQIDGPLIREVLLPIWLSRPESARRVSQRIGTILDWSCAKGYRASDAPMRGVRKSLPKQPKEDNHFAAMPHVDVAAFVATLRSSAVTTGRMALELTILTATRSGEVRGAEIAEFEDLDGPTPIWRIPAARTKMAKAHVVPLSPAAVALVKRANESRTHKMLLFVSRNEKAISDMTMSKIMRDTGTPYTVHGFRSSFRDWVSECTDTSPEVAEAALAHARGSRVEAAYARSNLLEKRRDLMAAWAGYVDETKQRTQS